MKILWLSNCVLSEQPTKTTGSWLQAMSAALSQREDVELYNITIGRVREITRQDCGRIQQWIVPKKHLTNGLPKERGIVEGIVALVEQIAPELIHIWGMELYWGLLTARGIIDYPTLLEIQGIRTICAEVWWGGLSRRQQIACISYKEIFHSKRRRERRWGPFEREIVGAHRYISLPSDWTRSALAPWCREDAEVSLSRMAVRSEFLECEPWRRPPTEQGIELFVVSSAPIPYKGVHIVLKAVALLKKEYPNIRLTIAGDYEQQRSVWSKCGYMKYLERQIKRLGLQDNINLPGPMSASELVEQMRRTNVMLHSSFVETYSLALAESMAVGVPSVVAWSGAMPELADNGSEALFYSPADYRRCAGLIRRLVEDEALAQEISSRARTRALERNSTAAVVEYQVATYRRIVESVAQGGNMTIKRG